jgi:TPR repeat protein
MHANPHRDDPHPSLVLESGTLDAAVREAKVDRLLFDVDEGDRAALVRAVKVARKATPEVMRRVLAAFDAVPKLTACELYYRGLLLFRLGDGVAAAISHTRAAEAGNADAMFELSVLYARGLGVRANADLSEAWLQRAAAANHPRALYNVGAAYASGAKGQPDYERAASYYERATYLGNGRAAATLAAMISAGEIPGTADEASAWLTMAEDLGFFPEPRRSREHAS